MNTYLGLQDAVAAFTGHLLAAMFPNCFGAEPPAGDWEEKVRLERALGRTELLRAMSYVSSGPQQSAAWADALEGRLAHIEELIRTDVDAAYQGDPAAKSREEVILAYPAFVAISTYRFAHELYLLGVPIVPRVMTEQAHSATGKTSSFQPFRQPLPDASGLLNRPVHLLPGFADSPLGQKVKKEAVQEKIPEGDKVKIRKAGVDQLIHVLQLPAKVQQFLPGVFHLRAGVPHFASLDHAADEAAPQDIVDAPVSGAFQTEPGSFQTLQGPVRRRDRLPKLLLQIHPCTSFRSWFFSSIAYACFPGKGRCGVRLEARTVSPWAEGAPAGS